MDQKTDTIVEKDLIKACKYFEKRKYTKAIQLAEKHSNNVKALELLGTIYSQHVFNPQKAQECLKKAITMEECYEDTYFALSMMYSDRLNQGYKKDLNEAMRLAKKGAALDSHNCISEVGLLHFDKGEYKEASEYFIQGEKLNHDRSIRYLALMYQLGYYVEKDYEKAYNLYVKTIKLKCEDERPEIDDEIYCLFEIVDKCNDKALISKIYITIIESCLKVVKYKNDLDRLDDILSAGETEDDYYNCKPEIETLVKIGKLCEKDNRDIAIKAYKALNETKTEEGQKIYNEFIRSDEKLYELEMLKKPWNRNHGINLTELKDQIGENKEENNRKIISMLADKDPYSIIWPHGEFILHWAAAYNNVSIAKYLLHNRKFHVDMDNHRATMPLYYATMSNAEDTVKLLVEFNACPRFRSGFSGLFPVDQVTDKELKQLLIDHDQKVMVHDYTKPNNPLKPGISCKIGYKYRKYRFWQSIVRHYYLEGVMNIDDMVFDPDAVEIYETKGFVALVNHCQILYNDYLNSIGKDHKDLSGCLHCGTSNESVRCDECTEVGYCSESCKKKALVHQYDCRKKL
jgi:tetratricopeptide (TPR) repeat protein